MNAGDASSAVQANTTVGEALAAFRGANQLDPEAERRARFDVKLGPLVLPFPNPGKLHRHDLHHVLLGASPSFWGEVEVSAFELRTGSPTALITLLCVGAIALGFVLAPRRVIAAWRRARGCTNVYADPLPDAALHAMTVAALRTRVGLAR